MKKICKKYDPQFEGFIDINIFTNIIKHNFSKAPGEEGKD